MLLLPLEVFEFELFVGSEVEAKFDGDDSVENVEVREAIEILDEVKLQLIDSVLVLFLEVLKLFGLDEDEFVENLDRVLTALAKRNMTVNPKKCRFGLTAIEYVGHVINAKGISHSPDRVEKVLSMQKPTLAKHLKSFLGVATYFRDHIRNHSIIVKPLHEMIRKYEKNKRLEWTQEGEQAYEEIREAIRHMPTLFFLDDRPESKVYLHTDASDYGAIRGLPLPGG